ncbi:hypothetical protein BJX70DRAFT_215932 [Aspergillus crustosus]
MGKKQKKHHRRRLGASPWTSTLVSNSLLPRLLLHHHPLTTLASHFSSAHAPSLSSYFLSLAPTCLLLLNPSISLVSLSALPPVHCRVLVPGHPSVSSVCKSTFDNQPVLSHQDSAAGMTSFLAFIVPR